MAAGSSLIGIAQKDHIVAEGDAAIRTQLRARPPHQTWQARKVLTMIGELLYKGIGGCAAGALTLDVCRDVRKVATRCYAIYKPGQLRSFGGLIEPIEVIADMSAHVFGAMAAPPSFRGIEHLAQLGLPGALNRVADRILGRRKPPGGQFGLDPLGSVRSKLDFHSQCFLSVG
jgi:hypothetical protein